MHFVIIGAGPVGVISARHLLKLGHRVTVITLNKVSEDEFPVEISQVLKGGIGGLNAYDGSKLEKDVGYIENGLLLPSKIIGGFSKVWGATWGEFNSLISDDWLKAFSTLNQYLGFKTSSDFSFAQHFGCNCLSEVAECLDDSIESVRHARLAIYLDGTCGCIGSGATFCSHGNIFDTSRLLGQLRDDRNFSLIETTQEISYKDFESHVAVSFGANGIFCDKLVLAAGGIGNSLILLQNHSNLDSVHIRDTKMKFLPLVSFRKKPGHSGGFGFSQYQMDGFVSGNLTYHAQIYAHPEIYEYRILSIFPRAARPLIRYFLKFLYPRLNIAIIYLDSSLSESFSISRDSGHKKQSPKVTLSLKEKMFFWRHLFESFRKLNLFWIMPIMSGSIPGASFHSGAMEGSTLDEFGIIRSSRNIGVAGTLSLPIIEPGPVTHSAMAQAIRLTNQMLSSTKI